ncbi:DKFZp434J1815 [Anopheles sinensis]|uniref:DKFZp434J1815 n=1 Tax=Anopheles sinensis TaxID=74873 RepID=A0A084WPK3_ANOSI|nr:DKFZp434J1815 [Anopheles sinensis]
MVSCTLPSVSGKSGDQRSDTDDGRSHSRRLWLRRAEQNVIISTSPASSFLPALFRASCAPFAQLSAWRCGELGPIRVSSSSPVAIPPKHSIKQRPPLCRPVHSFRAGRPPSEWAEAEASAERQPKWAIKLQRPASCSRGRICREHAVRAEIRSFYSAQLPSTRFGFVSQDTFYYPCIYIFSH